MQASQYNYVVTAQKSTLVSHSLVGKFTSPTDLNLIIAKGSRLEVHTSTPDGLEPVLETSLNGTIEAMKLVRPKVWNCELQYCSVLSVVQGNKQDSIAIITTRKQFCTLSYDAERGALVTEMAGRVAVCNMPCITCNGLKYVCTRTSYVARRSTACAWRSARTTSSWLCTLTTGCSRLAYEVCVAVLVYSRNADNAGY